MEPLFTPIRIGMPRRWAASTTASTPFQPDFTRMLPGFIRTLSTPPSIARSASS